MPRKPKINLPAVEAPMTKTMTVYVTERDFNRFETLARMRGEKGVSPLVRKLALAALDAFEVV